MVDAFKQELDELMGVNRNAAVDARLKHEHYSDPAVFLFCKIIIEHSNKIVIFMLNCVCVGRRNTHGNVSFWKWTDR